MPFVSDLTSVPQHQTMLRFGLTPQDVVVMLEVALRISAIDSWPEWKPGSEV